MTACARHLSIVGLSRRRRALRGARCGLDPETTVAQRRSRKIVGAQRRIF
jgi:hypothetical protein